VRYTQNQDGTFIDEIQSDISNSLVKKARSQAQKMDMGDDYVNHMAAKAEAIYPDTHHKKINEILFGGKDASEVLHEGFNQYLRDTGHVGKPIHTWNANSKAAISLGTEDETEAIPAHMQRTYDQVPKKMGYTPAQYGELSTQSDSELKHLRTQKTVLRKSDEEEYEEFIKSIESERCKIF
jgi:hypothetical protein